MPQDGACVQRSHKDGGWKDHERAQERAQKQKRECLDEERDRQMSEIHQLPDDAHSLSPNPPPTISKSINYFKTGNNN